MGYRTNRNNGNSIHSFFDKIPQSTVSLLGGFTKQILMIDNTSHTMYNMKPQTLLVTLLVPGADISALAFQRFTIRSGRTLSHLHLWTTSDNRSAAVFVSILPNFRKTLKIARHFSHRHFLSPFHFFKHMKIKHFEFHTAES